MTGRKTAKTGLMTGKTLLTACRFWKIIDRRFPTLKPDGERKRSSVCRKSRIEKTTNPKEKPGQDNPLVFGTIFTDHMFEVDYEEGKGWIDPRIVPYHSLSLQPLPWYFIMDRPCLKG